MEVEFERTVMSKLRRLPPERQREVLDFVEYLALKSPTPDQRQTIEGIFADVGVSLSADEIDQVRKEAWSGYPREDI